MTSPAAYPLAVYRGDDFETVVSFAEPGGRGVDDLVCVSGSATVTSASAGFTAADVGTKIATVTGGGITDGTTISSVSSSTQAGLSAAATASGTYVATIRALDASGYSSPTAQIRTSEDASSPVSITIDDARDAVGVYGLSMTTSTTTAMTAGGIWDFQVTVSSKIRTLLRGAVSFTKDVTHV